METVQAQLAAAQAGQASASQGKLGSKVSMRASAAAAVAAAGSGQAPAAPRKQRVVYVDEDDNIIGEEEEAEEVTDSPAFSLILSEDTMVRHVHGGVKQQLLKIEKHQLGC
jgi:hypothetical protein